MDDFLALVAFHPGHPILIFVGVAAAVAFLSLGQLALRQGSRLVRVAWLVGVIVLLAELAITTYVNLQLDWNPRLEESLVVGVWEGEGVRLELGSDGQYHLPWSSGRWTLQGGGALKLSPEPLGFEGPKFIAFGKTVRLVRTMGDPDEWSGELGLRRVE